MLHHAARAVPWGRVALAAALVVVLMELVRWNPWVLWPLEGTAVGLLAGAAAWCFDETAAAVVDTSPRGLSWRAAARSPAVLLLILAWAFAVARVGNDAAFGHLGAVLVQGSLRSRRVPLSRAGVAPAVLPRRACCSPPSSSRWRRSGRSSDLSATTYLTRKANV